MTAAVVETDDVVASAERADALTEVLADRWSCRAFLPEPVPTGVLRRMFDMAQRTASWCNTQPWHVYVATGGSVRDLASRLVDSAQASTGNPDIAPPEEYVGVYRERRREAGFALYRSLGIEREDREGRAQQMLKNFEFFDAPHVAIITTDRLQGAYGAIDCAVSFGYADMGHPANDFRTARASVDEAVTFVGQP